MARATIKAIDKQDFHLMRQFFCTTFCGHRREEECPKDCKMKNMTLKTSGQYKLNELLEVKNDN